MDVAVEQELVRVFAQQRNWEQFHTPKNLVMALTGESGELAALFQWLRPGELPERADLEDEIADVCIYLLRLADVLQVDLGEVVAAKVARNQERYPVSTSWGSAAKYTQLPKDR